MLLIFCLLLFSGWQHASAQDQEQKILDFSSNKKWLHALHYQVSGNGYKSSVDNSYFFLSQQGRYDPLAELTASIRFFNNPSEGEQVAKCVFPFRYGILLEEGLVHPDQRLCPKLDYFKQELGTDGASMVFVGQYADNPASIMRHSIIAFHNKSRQLEGSPLVFLDYAMNFAAAVPTNTNIIKYILFGIFGGFQVRYSLLEFGDVFEKYNNMEGRDIFYYRLRFSQKECERLIEHVWEMLSHASHDYFFFDENCAYQLLAVLQAIRSDIDLLSDLPIYVSPIEIVKTLVENKLVYKIEYEPSIFQRIVNKLKYLDKSDHLKYFAVLSDQSKVEQVNSPLLAEALIDTLTFAKHESQGNLSQGQAQLQKQLLVKRSQMGINDAAVHSPKVPPHLSHPDKRISFGGGKSISGSFFKLLLRPGVHDRLSRPQGYQRHSSLSFLQTDMRYYPSTKQFVLHECGSIVESLAT